MRFVIDNALSPALAAALNASGHDAVHVRDVGLRDADDEAIMRLAIAEERVIVSADTDSVLCWPFTRDGCPRSSSSGAERPGSPRRRLRSSSPTCRPSRRISSGAP